MSDLNEKNKNLKAAFAFGSIGLALTLSMVFLGRSCISSSTHHRSNKIYMGLGIDYSPIGWVFIIIGVVICIITIVLVVIFIKDHIRFDKADKEAEER